MNTVLDVVSVAVGILLLALVLDSVLRTFLVPRGLASLVTRLVFVGMRMVFGVFARESRSYEARDRVMAMYAPLSLVALVLTWTVMVLGAFTLLFHAITDANWEIAFETSGSSFFTLGFVRPTHGLWGFVLSFAEAGIGLAVLALLIAFLPTIYSTFSRRERTVLQLATRAGTPPNAVNMLVRHHAINWNDRLPDLWQAWEEWFAELAETHTSLPVLVFFRSPNPHRSWITSAGVVLDAAALAESTLAIPASPEAAICLRSGFNALREIADYYGLDYDPDPAPDDPISIDRSEFDEVYERLGSAGVPVRPNRDRAWRDFAGWRVNYDSVLLALAGLTMAPYAEWSSDRSLSYRRPRLMQRGPAKRPGPG